MQMSNTFISLVMSTILLVSAWICVPPEIEAQNEGALRGARIAVTTTPSGEADRVYMARENEIMCLDASGKHMLWTSPVVAGTVDVGPIAMGRIVVYISNDMSTITGLDADNGLLKWSTQIQSAHMTSKDKILFLATSTGMGIEALDAENGKKIWKYEPGGPGSVYELINAGGNIYTDSYVLNATNGRVIKKNSSAANVIGARADTVFKAIPAGIIEAVHAQTSTPEWKAKFSKDVHSIAMSANDKFLFFVGYKGMSFIAHTGMLQAFRITDGRAAWEWRIASSDGGLQPNPMASDRDTVYLLTPATNSYTRLSAISALTGEKVWSNDLKGKLEGPPVIAGEILYLTDGPNVLYEIEKSSGNILVRLEFPKKD